MASGGVGVWVHNHFGVGAGCGNSFFQERRGQSKGNFLLFFFVFLPSYIWPVPPHHHYSSEGATQGGDRSWPRALPSVLCCHSKLRPLCFVQPCGDLRSTHSAIKNFSRYLVCLVVFLGDKGSAQGAVGWCFCVPGMRLDPVPETHCCWRDTAQSHCVFLS